MTHYSAIALNAPQRPYGHKLYAAARVAQKLCRGDCGLPATTQDIELAPLFNKILMAATEATG